MCCGPSWTRSVGWLPPTGKDDARLAFPPRTLRTKALAVRRKHLLAMRGEGVIGDEALHRLEEELDFLDLALATQTHN
jgi:hypothetical protein